MKKRMIPKPTAQASTPVSPSRCIGRFNLPFGPQCVLRQIKLRKPFAIFIQRGLISNEVPSVGGFDIAAGTSLDPKGSGRNIWGHFRLSDGRIGLAVLHVQGEGLPAAHFLALARSLLREMALDQEGLVGLLARVNSGMADAVPEGSTQHVEAGICRINPVRI